MKEFRNKKRFRLGDVKKNASCCAGPDDGKSILVKTESEQCCQGSEQPAVGARKAQSCCASDTTVKTQSAKDVTVAVQKVDGEWSFADHIGAIRCRVSGFRNSYIVAPGLYAVGEPDRTSNVFVSANYKLSFDVLRRALKGISAWILVLDTKGINVWCAAGKGTFGTAELAARIKEADLLNIVDHRRVIVPQLGGPGIAAHEVQRATGFRVLYGPVRASDIPEFINNGYKASEDQRRVDFPLLDRLVLTPMELIPAFKHYLKYVLVIMLVFGIQPEGIKFSDALLNSVPFLVLGLAALFSGALVTPVLLPYVPFRSFAIKGWLVGIVLTALLANILSIGFKGGAALFVFTYLFFPMVSSYIALQFTGSTVYTGMSGVKKELRYAVPVYVSAVALSAVMLIAFKITQWRLI